MNVDANRWEKIVELWLASKKLQLTQDEDGAWSITVIEAVYAMPSPSHWTGDTPNEAIDALAAPKDAPNESRCTHKSSKIMRGIDNTYDVAWCDDCGAITWASDGYLTDEELHRSDREKWCQRRVLAWGCASEANGGKVCGWWCGHPETCAVALRADGETAEKVGK